MRIIRIGCAAIARFFISAIFLASAVNNILHWHETEKNLMGILCDWQMYIGFHEGAQHCFSFLTPWAPVLLGIATLFNLVGGLLILLGVREKLGAALLVLFLIPVTILYHQFWFIDGPARELQTIMFLKNLAILGAMILILLHGGQARSGGGERNAPLKLG